MTTRPATPETILDTFHPETRTAISRLGLAPHPEGGFFRETFRSPLRVATPRGERAAMTIIHYLLPAGSFSAFHRVHSDELWHHAGGDPLELHVIESSGAHESHRLGVPGGPAIPHVVVPAGAWQAARPLGTRHALVSCTVAPGFDFGDFEMTAEAELLAVRPDLARLFRALCRSG